MVVIKNAAPLPTELGGSRVAETKQEWPGGSRVAETRQPYEFQENPKKAEVDDYADDTVRTYFHGTHIFAVP